MSIPKATNVIYMVEELECTANNQVCPEQRHSKFFARENMTVPCRIVVENIWLISGSLHVNTSESPVHFFTTITFWQIRHVLTSAKVNCLGNVLQAVALFFKS